MNFYPSAQTAGERAVLNRITREQVIRDIDAYLAYHEDADGDSEGFYPNEEMSLRMQLKEARGECVYRKRDLEPVLDDISDYLEGRKDREAIILEARLREVRGVR